MDERNKKPLTNSHQKMKTLKLLTLLLLTLPAVVQAQFTFTTNNGAITITGYTGSGGAVVIPTATNGYPVTSITANAFSCHGITGVTIPNTITSIGDSAFSLNYGLISVTIPYSVTNMGVKIFQYDSALSGIIVDSGNIAYSSLNGVLFNKNQTTLIQFPGGMTGSYSVPSSVTNIASYAFAYCPSLHKVYFNGNAPSADSTVFSGDTLTVYYLFGMLSWGPTFEGQPASLRDPSTQFAYQITNSTIIITAYLGSDGGVTIPDTISSLPVNCIGNNVFHNCTNLTIVVISTNVTSIGTDAFQNCTSLSNITIPGSVTNIGSGAFSGCSFLTAITVATNNPDYSSVDGVLLNQSQTVLIQCPEAEAGSFAIPSSVTTINDQAFLTESM